MRNCRVVICKNLDCFADGIEVFSCTAIVASLVGTLVRGVSVLLTPACPAWFDVDVRQLPCVFGCLLLLLTFLIVGSNCLICSTSSSDQSRNRTPPSCWICGYGIFFPAI